MGTRRYMIYTDILNLIMIELFSVITTWYSMVLMQMPITPWLPLCFAIIIVETYFVRKYVSKLYWFFAIRVLMIVISIFLPLLFSDIFVLVIFNVIWLAADYSFWTNQDQKGIGLIPGLFALLFVVAFIYGTSVQEIFLSSAAYSMGIIYMGMFFLRMYFSNIRDFSEDKQIHNTVPMKLMFMQNSKMVFALVTIFVIAMLFLRSQTLFDAIGRMLRMLQDILFHFIEWVISLLPKMKIESILDIMEQGEPVSADADAQNPILEFILMIVEYIIRWVIMIVIIGYLLRGIYRFIIQYWCRQIEKEEKLLYGGIRETKEWLEKEKPEVAALRFGKGTNAEKIRRLYRKRIDGLQKKGYIIVKTHAPIERAVDIEQWGDGDVSVEKLTRIYEEARYSAHEMTAEHVKTAKSEKRQMR